MRLFVVTKAGFLNFGASSAVTFGNLNNQLSSIRDSETHGVFYPGGGVEFGKGTFGIRLEGGDEIFFDNGANHNFKFMGGPQIRF